MVNNRAEQKDPKEHSKDLIGNVLAPRRKKGESHSQLGTFSFHGRCKSRWDSSIGNLYHRDAEGPGSLLYSILQSLTTGMFACGADKGVRCKYCTVLRMLDGDDTGDDVAGEGEISVGRGYWARIPGRRNCEGIVLWVQGFGIYEGLARAGMRDDGCWTCTV